MKFYKRILAVLVTFFVFTHLCTCAFAASALFAAKELQLKDAVPSEADLDRPFENPMPARIAGTGGGRMMQLASCRDYLAVRNQIIGSNNENDYQVLLYQAIPCIALALLKSASIAPQTALPKDFLRQTDTTSYPATLWPAISNEEIQRLERPGATLHTASKKKALTKLNDETLELKASGFGLRLTLLARGDFNHDGWEDAAFRWESYALHGSYTYSRLVVLTRTNADSGFRELPLHQLLPKPQGVKDTGSGSDHPVSKGQ
jgi:hypothetical protein